MAPAVAARVAGWEQERVRQRQLEGAATERERQQEYVWHRMKRRWMRGGSSWGSRRGRGRGSCRGRQQRYRGGNRGAGGTDVGGMQGAGGRAGVKGRRAGKAPARMVHGGEDSNAEGTAERLGDV